MSENLEAFSLIVENNSFLKESVRSKKYTWQEIFDEWVLDKRNFNPENFRISQSENKEETTTTDTAATVNSIMSYIKKVNPDTLTKSLSTAQKVINMLQGFNSGQSSEKKNSNGENFFNSKFNDWY